jgi:hypothetical protein
VKHNTAIQLGTPVACLAAGRRTQRVHPHHRSELHGAPEETAPMSQHDTRRQCLLSLVTMPHTSAPL